MRCMVVMEKHQGGGTELAALLQSNLMVDNGHEVAHFSYPDANLPEVCPHLDRVPHYLAPQTLRNFLGSQPWPFNKLMVNKLTASIIDPIDAHLSPRLSAECFRKTLLEYRPDIVHFHTILNLASPEILAVPAELGIPSVLTAHIAWLVCPANELLKGGEVPCAADCSTEPMPGASCRLYRCMPQNMMEVRLQKFYRMYTERVLERCIDLVVAPSEALTTLIRQSNQLPAERTAVLYNATRREWLNSPVNLEREPEKTYFMFVGRLNASKGMWELLETFAQLPDIPLVIVGQENNQAAQFIRERGLTNINMVGWKNGQELWELYHHAYACVLPSRWFENAGLIMQESFAHAKPVIGSSSGGIPEFVQHRESGLIFDVGDTKQLKHHVQTLWDDPILTLSLGRAGYRSYQEFFNPAHSYQELMRIYKKAMLIHRERKLSGPAGLDFPVPEEEEVRTLAHSATSH